MCFESQAINYFSEKGGTEHYFAAANTCKGFRSYFGEVFSPKKLGRIYILKGGPGVGKSTLMKKAVKTAEEKKLSAVCYHCSSDPYSLDGVIIKEKGVAIVDGTAPHITDPAFAGVKEIIVNMGAAWDTEKLSLHEKEILSTTAEKASCYSTAYKYLAAEKQLRDTLCEINSECIFEDKLSAAVNRIVSKTFRKEGSGEVATRLLQANSCVGDARLYSFEKNAKQIYFIRDVRFVSEKFFSLLFAGAQKLGANVSVSYNPTDPDIINGLYFPLERVSFTLYSEELAKLLDRNGVLYRIINMRRFCDSEKYAKRRTYYRFGEKCRAEIHESALDCFMRAGLCHASLEDIYKTATDYGKVGSLSDKVMADIFG